MAFHADREAFIPYRRTDLVELCLEDGKLAGAEAQKFREFCEILAAYYHFEFHHLLELLKDNFAPFNPDADTKARSLPTPDECRQMERQVVETLTGVLERANYNRLSEADLQQAFKQASLVDLKTKVNFDDYERMLFFYRGDTVQTIQLKKYYIKTVEVELGVFERVVILLKFKDAAYFEAKGQKPDALNFTPGKIYLYLYKNIPRYDLELLFPNVEIGMTLKDRLLFGVPALGGAASVLFKALPQLVLITGVITFFTFGPATARHFGVDKEQVNNIMPLLAALAALLVAVGGLVFKQYSGYKNKQMKFQKDVTDTLFFRNLSCNAGVFHDLIDAAEEEECKEIILVYYHLLTHNGPLTTEALDDHIEAWMEKKFATRIDFDINGPLRNLEGLKGKTGQEASNSTFSALLTRDEQGICHPLPLDQAKDVLDYIWDNAFRYDSPTLT
jgi:hypothetical protein